ncbi:MULTISPECIES: hypothetical protein [Bacillus]|uniref:Group-specific protein n=2 Tax=Bacillus TaxID=1386 RepID=A0A0M3RAS6_9BACI|nr:MULTISPECIES: hypothetical protein [Bacillus]ALC83716.1 hypothetical protein AM592_20960 [Bacillus gobiensis]MBP1082755.1 hypothetical protein [Bacillus capparidis]MED1097029.1 hypothetical protein [Bacillus capparidis]
MNLLLFFLIPLLSIAITAWCTGSKEYGFGPNDDERKQKIKQKSVVQSWSALVLFFITNFLIDLFHLRDERLQDIPFLYPELLYLIILITSYFLFYIINTRKMSA